MLPIKSCPNPESVSAMKANTLFITTPVFDVMLLLVHLFLKMEPVDVLVNASSTIPPPSGAYNALA